jgi:hypothetical protein
LAPRYLTYLGPDVYMLLLDCRAERKKDQVCSKLTYDRIFAAIKALPTLKHLVFQLGIPIAYRPSSLCAQARDLAYLTLTPPSNSQRA